MLQLRHAEAREPSRACHWRKAQARSGDDRRECAQHRPPQYVLYIYMYISFSNKSFICIFSRESFIDTVRSDMKCLLWPHLFEFQILSYSKCLRTTLFYSKILRAFNFSLFLEANGIFVILRVKRQEKVYLEFCYKLF